MANVALVGSVGTATGTTSSLTGAYGQTPTAGNLLVAVLTAENSTGVGAWTDTGPSGWTELIAAPLHNNTGGSAGKTGIDVYYKIAAGGDSAPAFTSIGGAGTLTTTCTVFELSNADADSSLLDTVGSFLSGNASSTVTFAISTAGNVSQAGGFGISAFTQLRSSVTTTWNETGTGWTSAMFYPASGSNQGHTQVNYQVNPASGSALSDSGNFASNTSAYGTGLVLVIKNNVIAGAASLTGAGSITPDNTQIVHATLTGAGVITAAGFSGVSGTASLSGGGSVSPNNTQQPVASVTGGGGVTPYSTIRASSNIAVLSQMMGNQNTPWNADAGTGTPGLLTPGDPDTVLNPSAILLSGQILTGLGSTTSLVRQMPTSGLTGQGVITQASQFQGVSALAGTGSITPLVTTKAIATPAFTGAGTLTPLPTQQAPSTLTGAGAQTSNNTQQPISSGIGPNLFSNPGFETGLASPWTVTSGGVSSITADSTQVHSGSWAGKCTPSATNICYPVQSAINGLTVGSWYTWTVWVYSPTTGTTLSFDPQVGGVNTFLPATPITIPANIWTQLSINWKATGATLSNAGLIFSGMAGPLWIDDVYFGSTSVLVGGGTLAPPAPVQQSPSTMVSAGSMVSPDSFLLAVSSLAGIGGMTPDNTQRIIAGLSGLGVVVADNTQALKAALSGLGGLNALVTALAPTPLNGVGGLTSNDIQRITATLSALGGLTPIVTEILHATALSGLGMLTPYTTAGAGSAVLGAGTVGLTNVIERITASLTGLGQVNPEETEDITAALNGLGALQALVTTIVHGTNLTSGGSINSLVRSIGAVPMITGSGGLTTYATQNAPAALSSAGTTQALTLLKALASPTGTGGLVSYTTALPLAALPASGGLAAFVRLAATATLPGQGAASARVLSIINSATLAGTSTLQPFVVQGTNATLIGLGSTTASGIVIVSGTAFLVGRSDLQTLEYIFAYLKIVWDTLITVNSTPLSLEWRVGKPLYHPRKLSQIGWTSLVPTGKKLGT